MFKARNTVAGVLLFCLVLSIVSFGRPTSPALAAPSCTTPCHVATTGNDSNSGTTALTALRNIQTAVDQVSTGGTVIVAAGLYSENVSIPSGKNVTVNGAGAGENPALHTIVDGGDAGSVFTIVGGTVTLSDLTARNGAPNSGDPGSGVYAQTSNVTLQNLLIGSNGAAGVYSNLGNDLTVSGTTITGNTAFAGAGIRQEVGGDLVVINSTIAGNTATNLGGGIFMTRAGSASILQSTISGNSAAQGGGIYGTNTDPVTIVNSTIAGNTASGNGGGINNNNDGDTDCSNCSSITTLINTTIAGNSAVSGAGVYNASIFGTDAFPTNPATITLSNTIVADNSGDNCTNSASGGGIATFFSGGNNLSDDTSCGAFFVSSDDLNSVNPLLQPLMNNGGATQTRALGAGSPALSTGDAAICAAAPVSAVDQRGQVRPQGSGCDIGALESALSPETVTPTPTNTTEPPTSTPTPTPTNTTEPPTSTPTPTPTDTVEPPTGTPTPTPTDTTEPPTTTPTPTPTDIPGVVVPEPELYCPEGAIQVGGAYYGELYMPAVMSIGETFNLAAASGVTVVVGSMNGHPNDGCSASGVGSCNQGQDNEAFYILVDGTTVGFAPDHGEDRWEVFTYSAGELSAGDHSIVFAHAAIPGNNPWGSVSYKSIVCASPVVVPEEAALLEITIEGLEAEFTPTPTPEASLMAEDAAPADTTATATPGADADVSTEEALSIDGTTHPTPEAKGTKRRLSRS